MPQRLVFCSGRDLKFGRRSIPDVEHYPSPIPVEATNTSVQGRNGLARRDLPDGGGGIEDAVLRDVTGVGGCRDQHPVAAHPTLSLPSQVAERIVTFELDGAGREIYRLDLGRDQVAGSTRGPVGE